jgi:hypothetical protein
MTEQSGANELYIDHTGQTSEEQDYGEETTIELHAKEAPVDEIQTETTEPEQQANEVKTESTEELPEEQTKLETEEDKVKNIESMLNAYPLPTEQTTEMTPLTPSDE